MTPKEFAGQLHSLQAIVPDASWKARQRDVFVSQITRSGQPNGSWFEVADYFVPNWVSALTSKPAMVFAAIVLLIGGTSYASVQAAKKTVPGDTLYVAKVISEKAQLALTFDESAKAKLNLEFAGNRAEELAQVAASEPTTTSSSPATTELANNFNQEMSAAKTRLAKISSSQPNSKPTTNDTQPTNTNNPNPDEKVQVFGANITKVNNGIEVSAPTTANTLAAAEKLFAKRDYQGAVKKIDEASKLMDQPTEKQSTEVSGIKKATSTTKDKATSTKDVKEKAEEVDSISAD